MRLIQTETLELAEYFGDNIPSYAILSHTWGEEEVSFQDWQHVDSRSLKKGYRKIVAACNAARDLSIDHIWVDTNCINKESSSELSEAINSMFTWYQRSAICLVYLEDFQHDLKDSDYDIDGLANLEHCRYWRRGWTLQELLAPSKIVFFDSTWRSFGTKDSLRHELSRITSIQIQYWWNPDSVFLASIAQRMSWAAQRSTTRVEDMAYCLMGIFEVNMPLLYGEGERAFIRLQEEIIKYSDDQTVFCWSWPPSIRPVAGNSWNGCLAPRPTFFGNSTDYILTSNWGGSMASDFQLTNSGLRIRLPMLKCVVENYALAVLRVQDSDGYQWCVCLAKSRSGVMFRRSVPNRLLSIPTAWITGGKDYDLHLAHERDPSQNALTFLVLPKISDFRAGSKYAVLPVYSAPDDQIAPLNDWRWKEPWNDRSDINSAMIALKRLEPRNVWGARMLMESPKYDNVSIDLEIHIGQSNDDSWHVKTQISGETDAKTRVTRHEISLPHHLEFMVESEIMTTRVRSVLISFNEFLGKGMAAT